MRRALTECTSPTHPSQPDNRANSHISRLVDAQGLIPPALDFWTDRSIYSPWADSSTTSPACLALASVWLNNCRRNHTPCRDFQGDGTLPRRVINISNPERPFLEDGLDRKGEYVSLSYKWGDCEKFLTTSLNVGQHQQEISLQKLPKSFREAISVAYALGFQWLWIDALCILQDSKTDQASEINKMDQIFRSSVLTLYAAAGNSADAGLSVERDPRSVKSCLLKLKKTVSGRTRTDQVLVRIAKSGSDEPLFKRGWVLQEEILAARGLVFGPEQITFRCVCGVYDETLPEIGPPIQTIQNLDIDRFERRSTSLGFSDEDFARLRLWLLGKDAGALIDWNPFVRKNYFDEWYSMVKQYTTRSLTFSNDVLSALTGLSNALGKQRGCSYVSGLWEEDLKIGLLWYVVKDPEHPPEEDRGVGKKNIRTLRRRRPQESSTICHDSEDSSLSVRFPSWSWASVWGEKVDFLNCSRQSREARICKLQRDEGVQLCCGPEVTSAPPESLTLKGRTRIARIGDAYEISEDRHFSLYGRHWARLHDATTGGHVGEIALDSELEFELAGSVVHCLLSCIRWELEEETWNLGCLAMVPIDDSLAVFRRVGVAVIVEKEYFGRFLPDGYLAYIYRWGRRSGIADKIITLV